MIEAMHLFYASIQVPSLQLGAHGHGALLVTSYKYTHTPYMLGTQRHTQRDRATGRENKRKRWTILLFSLQLHGACKSVDSHVQNSDRETKKKKKKGERKDGVKEIKAKAMGS
jgi:hypothetical protein